MTETILYILYILLGTIGAVLGVPVLVFLCSKMATLGYLRAHKLFQKEESQNDE